MQHLNAQGLAVVRRDAGKSWYRFDQPGDEILVRSSSGLDGVRIEPLSRSSSVVGKLQAVRQSRLYVAPEERTRAEMLAKSFQSAEIAS